MKTTRPAWTNRPEFTDENNRAAATLVSLTQGDDWTAPTHYWLRLFGALLERGEWRVADLAAHLDVNRRTVEERLKTLEAAGLARHDPGRGTWFNTRRLLFALEISGVENRARNVSDMPLVPGYTPT